VHWAQVDAVLGRVAVAFDGDEVGVGDLLAVVEAAEAAHGVSEERFGHDRPELPTDVEPIVRALAGLVADAAGLALAVAGRGLPPLPFAQEAAALVSLLDAQPRLRRAFAAGVGPGLADLLPALASAAAHGLAHGPLALATDALHRVLLLDAAIARRACFERVSPALDHEPPEEHRVPLERGERPAPLPDGPVERLADLGSLLSLLGAAGTLALTREARRAGAALFAGSSKAGRLGRDAFASRLSTALSAADELVLDPAALRRLDRLDTVVIDAEVLLTARVEPDEVAIASGADHLEVHQRLRSMVAEADRVVRRGRWTAGPLGQLGADARQVRHLARALPVVPTHGLTAAGRVVAVMTLRRQAVAGWQAVVDAARRAGLMVAIAGDELGLVDRFGAHLLVAGGDRLVESIRMLQGDGCGVVLVGGGAPGPLLAADCSIGLRTRSPAPAADIVASDLATAAMVVEAVAVAREVSQLSARLGLAGSLLGILLGNVAAPGRSVAQAMAGTNLAALAAMAVGARAARSLARRGRPRLGPDPPWHELPVDEVLTLLRTGREGRRAPAAPPRAGKQARGPGTRFVGAVAAELANPLTPVLGAGALASAALGSVLDSALVAGVVVLNAVLGAGVRWRAEGALAALEASSAPDVVVRRSGRPVRVAASSLVPGDVVELRAGDVVAADARIVEAHHLEVDESSLTGESLPVAKRAAPCFAPLVAERVSMLYEGSAVLGGSALAAVVAVGADTEAARADATAQSPPESGVEARLRRLTDLALPVTALASAALLGAGAARGRPPAEALATAVGLSVAAVPEGLPVTATLAQLAAARRLSAHGALVRNPRALEALARADVLCIDKTGTLTAGRALLTEVAAGPRRSKVATLGPPERRVLAAALRATPPAGAGLVHMTDRAVVEAAAALGVSEEVGAPGWRREEELPFSPSRTYHATLGRDAEGLLLSAKGAPEEILERCASWRDGGRDLPLDGRARRRLGAQVERLARRGLRIIAVAQGRPAHAGRLDDAEVTGLTYLGFVALSDPVRSTAAEAVRELAAAGVELVMVTGDHASTAESVAAELGILNGRRVVTGAELERLGDDELDELVPSVSVFARVTPADKVRIVQALRRLGRSVAMTGDGANDAGAIRLADVGLALGARATPSARAAADVVVLDDRLETILAALAEGRAMWASVAEALGILLGGNAGELAFTVGVGLLTGRSPLSARQLLLVNLLTDVLPALTIALRPPLDRPVAELLEEGPDRSLSGPLARKVAERGLCTAAGAGLAWAIGRATGRRRRADTMALAALVGSQLGQTIAAARGDLLATTAALASGAVLVAAIEVPVVRRYFGCVPLGPSGWAVVTVSCAAATVAAVLLARRASLPR